LGGNFLNDSIKHKAIGAVRDRISRRTGQAKESLYIDANNTRGRLRETSQKAERSARDIIARVRNRLSEQIRRIKLKLEEALKERLKEPTKAKSQSSWLGR
jgi:urease accessory protein UreH